MKVNQLPRAIHYTLLCVICIGSTCVQADDESFESFSKRAAITPGEDSLRRVELPYAVLLDTERSDFSNIHVFDAAGQLMPSRHFTIAGERESLESEIELPLYPFAQDAQEEAIRASFEVSQTDDNTQISVTSSTAGAQDIKTNYVIHVAKEVRRRHGRVESLALHWSKPAANLIVPVKVEGSTDLQKWTTLAERVVVSDLTHNGTQLLRNRVPLRGSGSTYLRLSWPDSIKQFDIDSVVGTFTRSRARSVTRRQTVPCEIVESTRDTCQFRVPEKATLTGIEIPIASEDYFVHGDLYSSAASSGPWVRRFDFQQYKLTVDGQRVEGLRIRQGLTSGRYWQIRFDQGIGDLTSNDAFKVEVQWHPRYQVFLAQGQEPFQLTYGNPLASNGTHNVITKVLKRTNKAMEDVEEVALGPIETVQPVTEYWTRQRLETFGLWAVLLIGVGVLGRIAWNLFHSLRAEAVADTDDGKD